MSWQACPEPKCTGDSELLDIVIEPCARDLGGFEVRRVLPSGRRQMVGPFIFFDHIGPAKFEPGKGIDVRPHPHIGLATVTYLFDGELRHRDSLGYVQAIQPGAVNWMTAGRGIVHSERTGPEARARGARLHGIQSWVALPCEHEETDPVFLHHPADTLPNITGDGLKMRLIAGTAFGERSPVETLSPMFYADADVDAQASVTLPDEYEDRAAFIVSGAVSVTGQRYEAGRMLAFKARCEVRVTASEPAKLMLLGGAPLDGERHIWWNFVSSSLAKMEQAKADWKSGRFAGVPGETEFIPLPEK
jgi:redox-sensitive bicupin YhaK (pirin superfamily)